MTSEWKSFGSGWSGVAFYDSYQTRYFDGVETINGIVYYKEYIMEVATDYYSVPITTNNLWGPYYFREDSSGKFYRINPNDGTETVILDNQEIVNAQIGDPFPYPGATCNVQTIENVTLGTRILKKIKGINTENNTGTLEGVGFIGLACARGIEGNGGLCCYSKQGYNLQFSTVNCNLFPVPVRVNLSVNGENLNKISIYPNPTKGIININLNSKEITSYKLYNLQGAILKEGKTKDETLIIDMSNFTKGVYILKIIGQNFDDYKKIIKE
jgi:hypothetical protein